VESRATAPTLTRDFYAHPAEVVARELLGKVIVRHVHRRELRARIVETEAYVGEHDLASHSSKGRTARTEVMFGPPGHAYVYLIYGMHDMFNVVCAGVGDAQAVLVRAAEPLAGVDGSLSGPGRLARGMHISRRENGIDLAGDRLFIADDGTRPRKVVRTPRIGVDYAGAWKDELLRFVDAESRAVSKGR
jgi:DNA-3-methyladenine glycosylase